MFLYSKKGKLYSDQTEQIIATHNNMDTSHNHNTK